LPLFQVGGGVEMYPVLRCQDHDPPFGGAVPKYFGISKIGNPRISQNRVACKLGPGTAFVQAEGKMLVLE